MSLYRKAWLFMGWTILVLVTLPTWEPLVAQAFGPGGKQFALMLWVAHGIIAVVLFTCPDCRCSLFRSEGSFFRAHHPWPNKICSRCGRDHSG